MDDEDMLERAVAARGWAVERWEPEHENGLAAVVGRFRAVETKGAGAFEGDEGELMACVVGSAFRGDQSVSWWLEVDDGCGEYDVRDLSTVEPAP